MHESDADLRSQGAPILIGPPRTEKRGEWVRTSFSVGGLGPEELWFDVDANHGHFLAQTCDAAVAALLPAAMDAGRDLGVQGPMSERLLWNLRNTVIPVVRRQLPFLRPIRVIPEGETTHGAPSGTAILTGFSCGVDSFSALQDHLLESEIPEADRVTHLLFSHVGHHGYGKEVDERAEERWRLIRGASQDVGLPLLRVHSNTPKFYSSRYNARLNWMATMTVRNAAVPLLLQNGVRRFLQASTHDWRGVRVEESTDMTLADPILLPALGTERTELCSVGTEYTRVEKTRRISSLPLARRHLDVCIMEGHTNCSKCEKCLRTLITLDLLGVLEEFADRFDLTVYRRHKSSFLARVLAERRNPLHLEIQDLIRESGPRLSAKVRLEAAALLAWRWVPQGLRRGIRGSVRKTV